MGFNKKVLSKAVSELDKAKAPGKPKDIITDPMGQWKYPGKKTRIPGSKITMEGVDTALWAQPNIGAGKLLRPNEKHDFGDAVSYVDETPITNKIAKKGGTLQSKKYSKSMSATNKLFAKNNLFKNKKSKIFDPNSKFKSGGSKLGPINLNPNPLSHYELNYGYNLPTEQDGGVHGNPWLYTSMQENEGRDPGQIIGLGANFQHKSGLHGDANVELPFFNKNAERMSTQSLGFKKNYKGFTGDATLNNESYPGSKLNPSLKTSLGYNKNLGDHVGFGIEATNNSVPGSLINPSIQAGLTYNFQDGGENEEEDDENDDYEDDEYEEHDLTDEQIQELIEAGHRVEEVSEEEIGGYVQHELAKAQVGKETYSGPKFALQGPSSPKPKVKKTDTSPSVSNAKKLEQYYKLQEQKKQQAIAKQKENELMKRMPKTQVSDNTRTVTPNQAVSDVRNTAILNSPEYKAQQKAKKDAQAAFEKEQWKKYNKASTMEKIVDRSQAALSQPLLMASNALMGDQAYVPGMHEGLMNTESPDYDKFLSATGQSRGLGVNDVFNTFNPGNWGAHAANEMDKGNVVSGAAEMGLGLLGLKGLKTASGLVKGSAKALNKAEGKLAKFIPERAPGTPSTGGGNLNAGISPELITNAIGPKNKFIAKVADNSYVPFLNKAANRISPLNWVPGYGKKLEGVVKPMGNVIGSSIDNGNIVNPTSLIKKAKGLVKKSQPTQITTKVGKTNAGDIYSARFDDAVEGSNIKLGEGNKQGVIGRTFKTAKTHNVQNKLGENLTQVPLSDPGVALNRRLPFSNRYVPIDKEKLMNNKFQWSTTGAGAQKLAEKFGAATTLGIGAGIGTGAAAAYNYNPLEHYSKEDRAYLEKQNTPLDELTPDTTRSDVFFKGLTSEIKSPTEYLQKNADPYWLKTIGQTLSGDEESDEYKQGGIIEEAWEDELDEHTIALLRKAGYIVEEYD